MNLAKEGNEIPKYITGGQLSKRKEASFPSCFIKENCKNKRLQSHTHSN